jgi:hypothetical protein
LSGTVTAPIINKDELKGEAHTAAGFETPTEEFR